MTKFWVEMTKRINPTRTLILATSLFLMASCITVDKTAGEGLVPSDQIFKISIKEFDLPVQMKSSDSLQTMSSGALVIGANKDRDLGLTTSYGAFRMYPQKDTNSFGRDPKINYLRMYIQFAGKIVLDEADNNIPQNIYIHRLLTDLDTLKPYNNSLSDADYDPAPLNTGGNVFFGGDTLNIELPTYFARELLSATSEEMDSLKLFVKRFKGFVIKTDPLPGSLEGGRFNIITPTTISMVLSYNHLDDKIHKKDSLNYYFATDNDLSLNIIKHTSSGLDTKTPGEKIFIEGLAGVKPFIDMSQVKQMVMAWAGTVNAPLDKIVISKAEIILPFEYPKDYKVLFQFPTQLFLATRSSLKESDSRKYYQLQNEINVSDDKGSINKSLLTYNLNITSYFQSLLKGKYTKSSDLNTYILPVASSSNSMTGEINYFIDNTVYYKGTLNGNSAVRKPKLKIVYAIIP